MTTSVGKPFVDVKFDELMDREERDFKKGERVTSPLVIYLLSEVIIDEYYGIIYEVMRKFRASSLLELSKYVECLTHVSSKYLTCCIFDEYGRLNFTFLWLMYK